MPKDFLRFVSRPGDLLKALKGITIGSLIASSGFAATAQAASTTTVSQTPSATIVDRSKKVAKLILKLPGAAAGFVAQHRSHRSHSSHSSHRSHYSGSGGTVAVPSPPPPPPPVRAVPPATAAPAVATVPTNSAIGEIASVDKDNKTFLFKPSENVFRIISYRDDTKFETEAGASIRFDDFAEAANGQVPIAKGDKVELSWRMSADGRMPIAVTVLKKPK